ncbi:MAG: glycosyltransferase family 4 protein [Pseudomonadales bacterium]|nr:glycosyltransferase family 4 protein [Pseudomonadales bacterium]
MSAAPGLLAVFRDALARHGGLLALLGSSLRILIKEGPAGFADRKERYKQRLQTDTTEAQAPGDLEPEGQVQLASAGSAPGAAVAAPSRAELAPGMTLIGHPYAVLGRAEDIRTSACACDQAGIPFSLLNVHGDYGKQDADKHKDFPFFQRVGSRAGHRVNLFYLNADEMQGALDVLGPEVFAGPYNIGCFAWELSRFPEAWVKAFEPLHELWAPTRFIQQALAEKTRLPVTLMPFAIEPGPAVNRQRPEIGLPDDKFVFLFFFDFRSYMQRKNPWAVLEAFFRAFPPGSSKAVHLLIKVNGSEQKPDDYRSLMDSPYLQDERVQIVDQVLDDQAIKTLVQLSDCFVSLHRSEGFGRGLAEAMYYGKPVIATAYSGNVDFMHPGNACLVNCALIPLAPDDYPHGAGQLWADADVDEAAWYMTKLVDDAAYARKIGERAADFIKEFHSYQAVGAHYRRRLLQLGSL